ncbi:GTPase IMAP family member 8-like isoform X2 [Brachyhypopomus gauderio]|uniref:GTPase IMAP family member 8-like isoform X2 n=1 Tax=Brachyhypopomus gauderio TaxID=698409 RepID=UPI00404299BE
MMCVLASLLGTMAGASPSIGYQHRFGVVLVGRVGCGKSASGNTILGQGHFISSFGFSAVTKHCTGCYADVCGRRIHVVDTPGLDYPELSTDDLLGDVDFWAPVVHVFLLVVQLGRFTQEQRDVVKKMEEIFGERVRDITVLLFTHGDSLKGSIEEFIHMAGDPLQKIIRTYGNRYHVFHNESDDRDQVTELFRKIDQMRNLNKGRFYTIDGLCLKIVMVGQAGCGKSTSGNIILGEEKFTPRSFSAEVRRCDWSHGRSCGRGVRVVDTPALDCWKYSPQDLLRDIDWCAPVVHAFLLVIQLGALTQNQQGIVEKMENVYGQRCRDFTVVLFTHGDQLTCSVETLIKEADPSFKQLLARYGDRYHVFNNKASNSDQVRELFMKIDRMRDLNGHRVYIFEESELEQ